MDQFHLVEKDYLEEIAELKHLIIRLEDEITLRDSKDHNKRHYSSVKK